MDKIQNSPLDLVTSASLLRHIRDHSGLPLKSTRVYFIEQNKGEKRIRVRTSLYYSWFWERRRIWSYLESIRQAHGHAMDITLERSIVSDAGSGSRFYRYSLEFAVEEWFPDFELRSQFHISSKVSSYWISLDGMDRIYDPNPLTPVA